MPDFPYGVPKAVRQHGIMLHPELLEPGDLLLIAAIKPTRLSRRIQQTQGELYEWKHAQWHHAVVSGGGTEVCEALLTGVRAKQFWHYMNGDYEFRIRRLKDASPHERTRVAYYAATMAKTNYGIGALLPIKYSIAHNDPWKRSAFRSGGVICSQLYFEACMRVGFLLAPMPPDRVSPAHLSASDQMEDIPPQWIVLGEGTAPGGH